MARHRPSPPVIAAGCSVVMLALAASWCAAAPWSSPRPTGRVAPTPAPQRAWPLGGTIGVWFDAACTIDTLHTSAPAETVTAWVALRSDLGMSQEGLGGWEAAIAVEGAGVTDLGWAPLRGVNLAQSPRLRVSLHWDERWWYEPRPVVARGRLVVTDPGATVRIYLRACTPTSLAWPVLSEWDYPSEWFVPAPCAWPGNNSGSSYDNRPLSLAPVSGSEALPVAVINPAPAAPLLSVAPDTLAFGDVAPGVVRERWLSLANVGGGTLTGEIPAPVCAAFALVGPGGSFALAAGETLSVRYRFQPPAGGAHACELAIGAGVVLTGTATAAGSCGFTPDRLEYGTLPNGHGLFRATTFTNATADTVNLELWNDNFPGWVGGDTWQRVPPGRSVGVPIRYQPYQLTALDDSVGVPGCSRVRLHGTAVPAPPTCNLYGVDDINFGSVAAGFQKSETVDIRNGGDEALVGEAAVQGDGFTILAGGGPFTLARDESRSVTIAYSPARPDSDSGLLTLGADVCQSLPLRGRTSHCEITATELDFGTVPVGGTRSLSFQVRNLGPGTVEGQQAADCPHVVTDNTRFSVRPGSDWRVTVRYHPVSAGDHVCTVSLGPDIGLSLAVRGTGVDLPPVCGLTPAAVDFGQVARGGFARRTLRIANTGGGVLTGDARVEGAWFTITNNAGPFSLLPGAVRDVSLLFYASATGLWTGRFLAGTGLCAEVPLGATVPACAVLPDSLDFGSVQVGCQSQRALVVGNPGPVPLQDYLYSPGCGGVMRVDGSSFTIPAGGEITRLVTFAPQAVGALACTLMTERACKVRMVLRGVGLPSVPVCEVSPATVDFGLVRVGQSRNLTFTLTNRGCGAMTGTVPSVGEPFAVLVGAGGYELDHDLARAVTVSFAPSAAGAHRAELDLGGACGRVVLSGAGFVGDAGPDLVGVYFAPGDWERELHTTQPFEPVTAHLVLGSPSQASGISGWECCVEVVGGAVGTTWELPAGAFNVGTAPCFQVGLQERWPWESSLALATVRFLQRSPQEETLIYVRPYDLPSLPGTPVYAAGHDPGLLVPMIPVSGSGTTPVAAVNPVQVAVLASAPVAACEDGAVRLTWTYDALAADGCRLYRRIGEAPAVDPVGTPLTDPQGRINHSEPAVAAPVGTPVRYSYALLRGGEEVARSAETAIACAAPPPSETGLRPLFPNPFNPQVTVSFDLARPGRAQVVVFDVAGRRVRTLVDAELAAATHARTWDGRDDAGRPAPSGTYYARLAADGVTQLRKMTLVR